MKTKRDFSESSLCGDWDSTGSLPSTRLNRYRFSQIARWMPYRPSPSSDGNGRNVVIMEEYQVLLLDFQQAITRADTVK